MWARIRSALSHQAWQAGAQWHVRRCRYSCFYVVVSTRNKYTLQPFGRWYCQLIVTFFSPNRSPFIVVFTPYTASTNTGITHIEFAICMSIQNTDNLRHQSAISTVGRHLLRKAVVSAASYYALQSTAVLKSFGREIMEQNGMLAGRAYSIAGRSAAPRRFVELPPTGNRQSGAR